MIVENIRPLQRALRQERLANSRLDRFCNHYLELDGVICEECTDQPALFAQWIEKRSAWQDACAAITAVIQATEPLEPQG